MSAAVKTCLGTTLQPKFYRALSNHFLLPYLWQLSDISHSFHFLFNRSIELTAMKFLSIFALTATFLSILCQEVAYYEEIKDLPNRPEILLIDVREPWELADTGSIPTSINIPSM
jgi:hypothetical protein